MRPLVIGRSLIGALVVVLLALGLVSEGVAQKTRVPRGEVRVVDQRGFNWLGVTRSVFEVLVDLDQNGQPAPSLATGWRWVDDVTLEVTLRRGVRFHNGETFDAEIVKLNWDENLRVKQPFGIGEYMSFRPGSRLEILNPWTVRFVFSVPDGGVLAKIGLLHMASRQFHRELGWGEKSW
jgi:ABC-type transport system substrate-binding protein